MSIAMATDAGVIYTIGHSTRAADEFAAICHAHGIEAIADVRLIPKSRRYPHFNAEQMSLWLPEVGIKYKPFKQLGGRRRAATDSINLGWRNESFRGYADFMQTDAFAAAVKELTVLAAKQPTAIMCAEAVPWRCHRSLIADALLVRGWRVLDVTSATKASPHKLTPFAKVDGQTITYPAEEPPLFAAVQ
jgi:uncharacterized protein (DUF488 family)